jgi:hypothetical protein
MAADLEAIKVDIDSLGAKIKELKTSGGAKEELTAAVTELLAKKQLYADSNNGIGVDGKPFQANMSKSEKKKQAKAEKDAGAGQVSRVESSIRVETPIVN